MSDLTAAAERLATRLGSKPWMNAATYLQRAEIAQMDEDAALVRALLAERDALVAERAAFVRRETADIERDLREANDDRDRLAARVAEAEARGREAGLREAAGIAKAESNRGGFNWRGAATNIAAAILARIEEQQHEPR